MHFPLPELLFPGETVATLTAAVATLILAVKEIAFRRLRPRRLPSTHEPATALPVPTGNDRNVSLPCSPPG